MKKRRLLLQRKLGEDSNTGAGFGLVLGAFLGIHLLAVASPVIIAGAIAVSKDDE